jgi:predicted neutral ceramidase superfamily lipid hydrolase
MMKSSPQNTDLERKSLLSTLWIFVLLNMVYADILGMLRPGYLDFLDQMSQQLTGSMVLFFAVFMEIAISMILLSRVLAYKANRWAHFIAIPLTILWVVVPALMPSLGETTPLSYVFFASVEVVTMAFMFWYVWQWPQPVNKYNQPW